MMRNTMSMLTALVSCLAVSSPARAQLLNPGFETGSFTNWTTTGNATVVAAVGSVTPDSGSQQAQLTTGNTAVPVATIETFLGLAPGSLNPLGNPATEGTAIKQSITVTAGSTLTIRYNFLTNENTPDAVFNDFAFFCVVGPGGTVTRLANTQSAPFVAATGTPYAVMTGYRTFTHTFTASGTVTIGIGVMDVGDTQIDSALLVDSGVPTPGVNVVQTGGSTNVAEGGASDTYTIVLNTMPAGNVTITPTPDTQVIVSPAVLTFTPANWSTPQTLTVAAVDDFLVEGNHTGVITHTAVSADPVYNGIAIISLTVNIKDNDGGGTHTLSTGVGDGSLKVVVDAFGGFGDLSVPSNAGLYDPVGPIGIKGTAYESWVALRVGAAGPRKILSKNGTTVSGTLVTCTSSFTIGSLSFNLVQNLTPMFVGPNKTGSVLTQTYTITNTGAAASAFELVRYFDGDLWFDGTLTDGGGRLAGPPETFFETDKGGTGATSTTFVGIQCEGGVIPANNRFQFDLYRLHGWVLNGNALNDKVFRDINADEFVDPGQEYDIHIAVRNTFNLAVGANTVYKTTTIWGSGTPLSAISGVTVTESGGSTDVAEGGATDTYTVVLQSAPTANVTITLSPDSQVTVSPSTLIFTPLNWNTPQTVTVTAVDDSVYEGPHSGTITHAAASADAGYNNIAIVSVVANITDNEPAPVGPGGSNGPEGDYSGSTGFHPGPEGEYGLGGRAAAFGKSIPALLGPFLERAGGVKRLHHPPDPRASMTVYNASYLKKAAKAEPGDGGTLLSALAVGAAATLVLLVLIRQQA